MEKGVDSGVALKAFDHVSHKLLIAKLDAYGFDRKSLKLVYSHLLNHKQIVKPPGGILFGVSHGSILRLFLFNIFICDLVYCLEDHGITNYADNSTPYSAKTNHKLVIKESEMSHSILFKWLQTNHMKVKYMMMIDGSTLPMCT